LGTIAGFRCELPQDFEVNLYIYQKNFRFIFIPSSSARHPRAEPPAYHAIVFGIAPSDEVPNPQKKNPHQDGAGFSTPIYLIFIV